MLPQLFTERMQSMLGEEYPLFAQSLDRQEYRSLRLNPLKGDREAFFARNPFSLSLVEWEQNGFYYGEGDMPGKHPYHEAGVYYIQEASAMAPVVYLDAKPGERILDLCAAPGGKSTQIAAAMGQEGILVCNEPHPARAKVLSENIERMGIANALVLGELPGRLAERFPEYFDRILVDAPCSGEGMFRKNEEACAQWSPENVRMCAKRQDEILDHAARMLRAGGRLVYSTCTFSPQENEGSVARFLMRHPEFVMEEVQKYAGMDGGHPEWTEREDRECPRGQDCMATAYAVRLWPHKIKGEGHFFAVLKKEGSVPQGYRVRCPSGTEKAIDSKECEGWQQFERENLRIVLEGGFFRFGDQLYRMPQDMPSLKGLKVLRPGLHLGTVKKNRFEPSHALALYLKPQDVVRTFDMTAQGDMCRAWLAGMTLEAQGEAGWYLMTADGYSIGWGKLSGTVMKNHYPKGLRRDITRMQP